MADLKGTKTEENLKAALAGESQARVKYEFYASQAKKDGYVEIKEIFQEGKRQNRSGHVANLGWAEPRHPETRK
mgnify:CR=1 FL=1